ncbi:MAG: cytochrome c biogenesis CcdA family protein [Actinomycetota bacterium]
MPIGLALVAGGLASVNPCGFSLLPALLSFYIGADERRLPSAPTRILQGLYVGAIVTAGFMFIFAVVGVPITLGATQITQAVPWAGVVIGGGLVLGGLMVMLGKHVSLSLRRPSRASNQRSPHTMFVFGMAYGTASLGCTLPVFLAVVGASLATRGTAAALVILAFYGLGMALMMMTLAIGAALVRQGIARGLKSLLPHMDRIAGGLLVLSGAYLTYFWSRVLVLPPDRLNDDPVLGFVGRFTAAIERLAGSTAGRWAVVSAALVVALTVAGVVLQHRARQPSAESAPPAANR